MAILNFSIHTPGLGRNFSHAGFQLNTTYGETHTDGEKNQHDERRALGKREAERDAQKRRSAGRGQNGGQHAVEKCTGRSVLGGNVSGRVECASAERDFKHAEQVQCDERDENGEADEKNGVAELHAPTGLMSGGLDADNNGRECEKRNQHAGRIDQTHCADVARFAFGLADETEDFQRDDRQHARHQIQDQAADEGVEQHLPEWLRW